MASGPPPTRAGTRPLSVWMAVPHGAETAIRSPKRSASGRQRAASHISVNTMGAGLRTVDDHLAVLEGVSADISSLNR